MLDSVVAKVVAVTQENDVIIARQEARAMAARLGFSLVDQARITTAVSELARNIIVYAGHGEVTMRAVMGSNGRAGVEFAFDDAGPGIADLDLAMTQGYTSGKGLGAGLPGTQRLMDEFSIQSAPGEGVHVVIKKWK